MPKRSSDAASNPPAAKRGASKKQNQTSDDESLMQRAQTFRDRLDYRTAEELCSEIIDSNLSSKTQALLLRSVLLEKKGSLSEGLRDVECAVNAEQNIETHSRAGYSFLKHALHHFEEANKKSLEDPNQTRSQLSRQANFEHLIKTIETLKPLEEKRNHFGKVSGEVFLKIASFFDATALLKAESTDKFWRGVIGESSQLFKNLDTNGSSGSSAETLLELFNTRSGNSLETVNLSARYKVDPYSTRVPDAILLSSRTLKHLSFHCNSWGSAWAVFSDVIGQCHSLSSLSISDNGDEAFRSPPSWKARLQVLEYKGKLTCDESLLQRLEGMAKEVILNSPDIEWKWGFKLISSTPSLVKLILPKIKQQAEGLETIPDLDLPNLTHLHLNHPPKEKPVERSDTCTSAQFFSRLLTPKLESLEFGIFFQYSDFASLNPIYSPKAFRLKFIEAPRYSTNSHKSDDASSFVNAIKSWERLEKLDLDLRSTAAGSFWAQLLLLLTPLTRENIKAQMNHQLVFPNLSEVSLGGNGRRDPDEKLFSASLAAFVASRQAVARGLSTAQVMMSASGLLDSSNEPPSGEMRPFPSLENCRRIEKVSVYSWYGEEDSEEVKFLKANTSFT